MVFVDRLRGKSPRSAGLAERPTVSDPVRDAVLAHVDAVLAELYSAPPARWSPALLDWRPKTMAAIATVAASRDQIIVTNPDSLLLTVTAPDERLLGAFKDAVRRERRQAGKPTQPAEDSTDNHRSSFIDVVIARTLRRTPAA
jgi:hypothetical protein